MLIAKAGEEFRKYGVGPVFPSLYFVLMDGGREGCDGSL
jgi:hypothetical protein